MPRALSLLLALALLGAGCSRDKGAVLVRWRLVDSSTGQGPVTCSATAAPELAREDRACCARVTSERSGSSDVIIDHIRLRAQLVSQGTGGTTFIEATCASCCFICSLTESTTFFELDPGEYKLWIEALRCGVVVGVTPPALVRRVIAGEITNLNSIEVRVDPMTDPVVCALEGGVSHQCQGPPSSPPDGGHDAAIDSAAPVPDAAPDASPDASIDPGIDAAVPDAG